MDNSVASQGSLFKFQTPTPPVQAQVEGKNEIPVARDRASLPPMLRHYLEIKDSHPDRLVFFQVGDFFEVFFEDAYQVSDCLSIRLTSRDKDQTNPIPMCGVPIHAFKSYAPKLLENGLGCVVVEQVEEASQAKGLVKRDITRILTPGVSFESEGEDQSELNYLVSILSKDRNNYALAVVEASTGRIILHDNISDEDLFGVVLRYMPREIVFSNKEEVELKEKISTNLASLTKFKLRISEHPYEKVSVDQLLASLYISEEKAVEFKSVVESVSAQSINSLVLILSYISFVSRTDKFLVSSIQNAGAAALMNLDGSTIKNLEIITSYDGSKEFSLSGVLDKTRTALGSRQLKDWLLSPSLDISTINQRYDKVQELIQNNGVLTDIRRVLYEIRDLERLCAKIISGRISPYDLGLLAQSLKTIPAIKDLLSKLGSKTSLAEFGKNLVGLPELVSILEAALLENLPIRLGEGSVFKDSYNADLQRFREIESGSKKIISNFEKSEKQKVGASSLKVKHNSVLGYFIEISLNQSDKAPIEYIKKQTLSNVERFFTPELKTFEKEIFSASAKIDNLERELFIELKKICLLSVTEIQNIAQRIGILDALCSFAIIAKENSYCRPSILEESITEIKKGRHPVVEKSIGRARFVPNDVTLDCKSKYFAVLTGPNMGGKSTYLRKLGVIQIMAQAGSFVPAESANLGLVDRIFTRIGSGDSLAKGDSTFMVEMREAADIVLNATNRSLVLVDELGRGTATRDGYGLALAIAEWLIEQTKSRTIFASHFHELNELEKNFEQVSCLSVGILETLSRIEFTHRIEMKAANKSYGIHVARLAGIPSEILKRASYIAAQMTNSGSLVESIEVVSRETGEHNIINQELNSFVESLKKLDPDELSPKSALNVVYEIVKNARQLGELK